MARKFTPPLHPIRIKLKLIAAAKQPSCSPLPPPSPSGKLLVLLWILIVKISFWYLHYLYRCNKLTYFHNNRSSCTLTLDTHCRCGYLSFRELMRDSLGGLTCSRRPISFGKVSLRLFGVRLFMRIRLRNLKSMHTLWNRCQFWYFLRWSRRL